MIDESARTDPIRAEHNGLYAFPQVLSLFPVEYLSTCKRFFCADPHACCKHGSHPSFFILPPSDLIHQGHEVGEDCFGLDIDLSANRIGSEWSVVHEDFPEFFQCVFSQLHCFWVVFMFNPTPARGFFHPAFPSVQTFGVL